MGERGQITLIVIVGLILLIIVGFMLYIRNVAFQDELQRQAEESLDTFMELSSLNFYVKGCLDRVSTEGLILLGQQGGVIYDYQGGLTLTNDSYYFQEGMHYIPYNFTISGLNESWQEVNYSVQRNVSYGIGRYVACTPEGYYSPGGVSFLGHLNYSMESDGFFPVRFTYFDEFVKRFQKFWFAPEGGCRGINDKTDYSGYMGYNLFPKLCSYNGSNSYIHDTVNSAACIQFYRDTPSDPLSMQRQLESYVKNNIGQCLDLDNYEQTLADFNITVNEEDAEVESVLKKPSGLTVRASYPFTVSVENRVPIIEMVDFQTEIDVNILRLYDYIYRTIINMTQYPDFNLLEDYNETSYYSPIFSIDYDEMACENCTSIITHFDDVVTITDQTSLLKGKPFSFTFGIRQQRPILDYMHDRTQSGSWEGFLLDYVYYSNSTITLLPEAVDLNMDEINYTYYGWKETYDERFNYTCCDEHNNDPLLLDCNLSTHQMCLYNITISGNLYEPNNWTNSTLYKNTNQSAEYESNASDIGYHEVTVVVEDEHGEEDFQIVRMLIFDLPVARLNSSNNYSDVNNSFASVEDEYFLNASASTASVLIGGNISKYKFKDLIEPFQINTSHPNNTVLLPNEDHNFSNVTIGIFNWTVLNLTGTSILHNISLVVEQDAGNGIVIQSMPDYRDVYVSECLPHGQVYNYGLTTPKYQPIPDHTNSPIQYYWPVSPETMYNAPHVCCEQIEPIVGSAVDQNRTAGKRRSSGEVCFDVGNPYAYTGFYTCYPITETYTYLDRAWLVITEDEVVEFTEQNYNEYCNTNGPCSNDYFDLFPSGFDSFEFSDLSINNLFEVDYKQYCDGKRGNVCGGDLSTTWTIKEDCSDFNSNVPNLPWDYQIARCQGPGYNNNPIPKDKCVENNILFESYIDTDLMECYNYTSGENFEKTFLGFSSTNHPDYDPYDADIFSLGFCAPPTTAEIVVDSNYEYVEIDYGYVTSSPANEVFLCNATCGTGICDFQDLNYCTCNEDNALTNSCYGKTGDEFFNTANFSQFVCEQSSSPGSLDVACDLGCEELAAASTPEGCYCEVQGVLGNAYDQPVSSLGFNGFFGSPTYPSSTYVSAIPGDKCCHDNNYIDRQYPLSGTYSCFDGNVLGGPAPNDPEIIYYQGDYSVMSCKGELYYCCGPSCTGNPVFPGNVVEKISSLSPLSFCSKTCSAGGDWV